MYKTAAATADLSADFTPELNQGETVTTVVGSSVAPAGQLVITTPALASSIVSMQASGGQDGVNYLIQLVVATSSGRLLTRDLYVSVTETAQPIPLLSPDAFRTIIDEVFAGESVKAQALFLLPGNPDTNDLQGTWEILDSDGTLYASGGVIDKRTQIVTNIGTRIQLLAVVNFPSTLAPSKPGTKYQLRWTLSLADGSTPYLFDNFTVRSPIQAPNLGSLNTVELATSSATLGITLPQRFDHVQVQLYYENNQELSEVVPATDYQPVSSGHYYSRQVNTAQVAPSLEPYVAVWKWWLDAYPSLVYSDAGQCYIVNPSISSVMSDLRAFANKINEQDFCQPSDLMSYLRTGADEFNAFGNPTMFTMVNAKGAIRAGWLIFAQIRLLRARYLEEGAKAFDYNGQEVSLSQDRTQYIQSVASDLEQRIENLRDLKYNLAQRGNTAGDGSNAGFTPGTASALGVTLSPLSRPGRFRRVFLLGR